MRRAYEDSNTHRPGSPPVTGGLCPAAQVVMPGGWSARSQFSLTALPSIHKRRQISWPGASRCCGSRTPRSHGHCAGFEGRRDRRLDGSGKTQQRSLAKS